MNLFKSTTLLYLSFHAIGFVLMMFSVLGIPGNLDENKLAVKWISKVINLFIVLGWYGIGVLALISAVAFYFEKDLVGKATAFSSLAIGLGLVASMIVLYSVKDR